MTRAEIDVVWLIDSDPPSPLGGRAFYPETAGAPPADTALMAARFAAMQGAVAEAGAPAVVTLHTSPRHRDEFFEGGYGDIWRACLDTDIALALHPHEDLADGTNSYGDPVHLAQVIAGCMARARAAGLPISAFRSGTFAWNAALPAILERHGILLDLSPGPGLSIAEKNVAWPAEAEAQPYSATRVHGVPIGWSGEGNDLDRDYLFVERQDMQGLCRVWDRMRTRVQRQRRPALCNLLAHGFGLEDPAWRALCLAFLDHLRRHGGAVISASKALDELRCSTA